MFDSIAGFNGGFVKPSTPSASWERNNGNAAYSHGVRQALSQGRRSPSPPPRPLSPQQVDFLSALAKSERCTCR